MRILIAHNYYQQAGGEDVVFAAEAALLERRGHTVTRFVVHNDAIGRMNKLKVAATTIWNQAMRRRLRDLVRTKHIEVAHFHNTFPLISPAALSAAREAGAAVVQTLHNHRLVCANGMLSRDGHVCHDCLGHNFAWPGIVRGCYRGSKAGTAVVAIMQTAHRFARTWEHDVDAYIAPSESTRQRLCGAGLPADRVIVKPHFVDPDPGPSHGEHHGAIFVGRLSEEKGLRTLLRAWEMMPSPPPLRIIGDGPLASLLKPARAQVQWLGRLPMEAVYEQVGRAAALILASQCHETFGRVIAEAYAKGTPVIASNLGTAPQMVRLGITGMLFEPGDPGKLAACVEQSFANPNLLARMQSAARQEYEAHYHADPNYEQLVAIYRRAIAHRARRSAAGASAPTQPSRVHHDQLGRWQSVGLTIGRSALQARDPRDVLRPAGRAAPDDARRASAAA